MVLKRDELLFEWLLYSAAPNRRESIIQNLTQEHVLLHAKALSDPKMVKQSTLLNLKWIYYFKNVQILNNILWIDALYHTIFTIFCNHKFDLKVLCIISIKWFNNIGCIKWNQYENCIIIFKNIGNTMFIIVTMLKLTN